MTTVDSHRDVVHISVFSRRRRRRPYVRRSAGKLSSKKIDLLSSRASDGDFDEFPEFSSTSTTTGEASSCEINGDDHETRVATKMWREIIVVQFMSD